MEQSGGELAHLERLADELGRHGLAVTVVQREAGSYLKVATPGIPALTERVLCGATQDAGWCFWWPWRQPIGPVDDLGGVVEKIMIVLRPVEGAR